MQGVYYSYYSINFDQVSQFGRLIGVGLRGIVSKYDLREQVSFETLEILQPDTATNKLIKEINKKYHPLLTGQKL